jgi:diguanylate cyclase (GGDEF)-like protein
MTRSPAASHTDLTRRVQELERALARAEREAVNDTLTGVLNRRGWDAALTREDDRCRRHRLQALVIVVDLDELKRVNDDDGHHAGDELLRRCGVALVAAMRAHDVVARVGGDEFAMLALHAADDSLETLRDRVRHALSRAHVKASIGAATLTEGASLVQTWQVADRRMLVEKQKRRRR